MNPFSVAPGGRILISFDFKAPVNRLEVMYRLHHRPIGTPTFTTKGDYTSSFASELTNLDTDYQFEAFWRRGIFRYRWQGARLDELERTENRGVYRVFTPYGSAADITVQVYPGPAED